MLIWLKNPGKVRYRTFQLRFKRTSATLASLGREAFELHAVPAAHEYQGAFLKALRLRGELMIDRVQLEAVPRMTPGETIEPYFLFDWRVANKKSIVKSYKSIVGKEVENRVTWAPIECALPITQSLEQYTLELKVFAGTAMSDYVANSRFTLQQLSEFVRPCDYNSWVIIIDVEHCKHVKLAKRSRVPTRVAIYCNTEL